MIRAAAHSDFAPIVLLPGRCHAQRIYTLHTIKHGILVNKTTSTLLRAAAVSVLRGCGNYSTVSTVS